MASASSRWTAPRATRTLLAWPLSIVAVLVVTTGTGCRNGRDASPRTSQPVYIDAGYRPAGPRMCFVVLSACGAEPDERARLLSRLEAISEALPGEVSRMTGGLVEVRIEDPALIIPLQARDVERLLQAGEEFSGGRMGEYRALVKRILSEPFPPALSLDVDVVAVYSDLRCLGAGASLGRVGWRYRRSVSHTSIPVSSLKYVGTVMDLADLPTEYSFWGSRVPLLLHETLGHYWSVPALASRSGGHYLLGLEGEEFGVMHSTPWRHVGKGRYTVLKARRVREPDRRMEFHPWTLVCGGVLDPDEAPQALMLVEPDAMPTFRDDNFETTGTHRMVLLSDVLEEGCY